MPIIALLGVVTAAPERRQQQLPIPQLKGKQTLQQPIKVQGSFDGGMKTYWRDFQCQPNQEGGSADAVFVVQPGGTLSNVIIGPDQQEGIRCLGGCTLNNCWFQKVCEDGITVKGQGVAFINRGGAQGAVDKVVCRYCGNCKNGQQGKRNLIMQGVKASNGQTLVGVNANFGDTAVIKETCASNVKEICASNSGTSGGGDAEKQGSGQSQNCQFGQVPQC